jgi:hypothetical protein
MHGLATTAIAAREGPGVVTGWAPVVICTSTGQHRYKRYGKQGDSRHHRRPDEPT